MFYFAYCTFLSSEEVNKYMPGGKIITKATAHNHKLEFCGTETRNDRGWCHLNDTVSAKGETTIGLVVEHDPKLFVTYPDFERCFLTVYGDDGKQYDCWTLRMTNPTGNIRPPKDYWALIDNGMVDTDLPEDYISKVRETFEKSAACQSED